MMSSATFADPLPGIPLLAPKKAEANKPKTAAPEVLTLEKAIQKAFSANRALQQTRNNFRGNEISYENAFASMFFPEVKLGYSGSSTYTAAEVPGVPSGGKSRSDFQHGYPSSSAVTLSLGTYTLFNGWKDWTTYQRAKARWEREQQKFQESVRQTRINVTKEFFNVLIEQEKLDAAKRSVEIAESIVELVKSRVAVKKALETDVSSAEMDLVTAKNTYNQQEVTVKKKFWSLNKLFADPLDTPYTLKGTVKFIPLKITYEEALKQYMETSPGFRDQLLTLKNAELDLEQAKKAFLPLPQVSLSGIDLKYSGNYERTSPSLSSSAGGNLLNISTSISLSLPIYGSGGLFNHRSLENSEISYSNTVLQYADSLQDFQTDLITTIESIRQSESQYKNTKESFVNSAKVLDGLINRIGSEQFNRLELKQAIKDARDAEISLLEVTSSHLTARLDFAYKLGLDQLPGESY